MSEAFVKVTIQDPRPGAVTKIYEIPVDPLPEPEDPGPPTFVITAAQADALAEIAEHEGAAAIRLTGDGDKADNDLMVQCYVTGRGWIKLSQGSSEAELWDVRKDGTYAGPGLEWRRPKGRS